MVFTSYLTQIFDLIDDFVKKYVFYPIEESDDEDEDDVLSEVASVFLVKKCL